MNEQRIHGSAIAYRPDVDGLRCVAVLSVFAFHLSPSRVPGGYVGVDVFFVISGYLISAIMFSEIASYRFSVLAFYERRMRRIFPALFGMLLGVSLLISFFLLPTEFVTYAKSVAAATLSSSNFYFWQHSGYFDSPTSNPLLHTWSLAVEEQFYILFPIFLVLTRRLFPNRLKHAVVFLFLASLAASAVTVRLSPTTAFYMPYTRAWELLAGTIIALGILPKLRTPALRNVATLLGIGMIAYSVLRYTPQTPFPGLAALIPCCGSALIIWAGEAGRSLVGRILSLRPIVFVGLISYSLYLWHWPLIVLNGLGLSVPLSVAVPAKWSGFLVSQTASKLLEILIAFVLATLSWRYIERPFRSRERRIERRPLFALSAATVVVLLAFSGAVIEAHGFRTRFPSKAVQVASYLTPSGSDTLGQLGDCVISGRNRASVFARADCIHVTPGKRAFLLVGDSHAGALWQGLQASLPDSDIALAAVWGCRPSVHAQGTALCRRMMDFIFQQYLASHSVDALLLEARWYPNSLNGIGEIAGWARSHGVPVIVFGPVAEYDTPLPRLLAYSIAWHKPHLAEHHLVAYSPVMDARMHMLAENDWHVPYVSLYHAACTGNRCLEYANEENLTPLLTDTDHLSEDGSRLLVRKLIGLGQLECMSSSASAKEQALVGAKSILDEQ